MAETSQNLYSVMKERYKGARGGKMDEELLPEDLDEQLDKESPIARKKRGSMAVKGLMRGGQPALGEGVTNVFGGGSFGGLR